MHDSQPMPVAAFPLTPMAGNTQRFIDLYTLHRGKILDVHSRCETKAGPLYGPYLIAPHEAYWQSVIKLAFVGHETNGWETTACDILRQMARYRAFNLGAEYYSSPFWNIIRKFEHRLSGGTYCSVALNINRYDQDQGRPSWQNQQVLSELDFLLLEELQLLDPDIVVLLTGPHYEPRIKRMFGGSKRAVSGYTERQLCEIFPPSLRGRFFRTYHPNYLRRSKLETGVINSVAEQTVTKKTISK
jgi:hypothetical protein